jgi:hypothetical protein
MIAAIPERRFPPPWSVEDINAAFVVKDSTGQKISYIYCGSATSIARINRATLRRQVAQQG